MNIGDTVRFLSTTGGGTVRGFKPGNIVLVEDEDGFEIPTLADDLVVIEEVKAPLPQPLSHTGREEAAPKIKKTVEVAPAFPLAESKAEGANNLNVYLAFVPSDAADNTGRVRSGCFDCYLVNDCNYYLCYTYMAFENAVCNVRSQGIIEPNTKAFVEQVSYADLNAIERIAMHLSSYKLNRPFALKPAATVQMRLDTTKFYKLHTFRESPFFNEPALVFTLMENDQPTRPLVISPQELKQAMYKDAPRPEKAPARQSKGWSGKGERIVIDLHADELLDSTAGLTPLDIKEFQLKTFRETMDTHAKEKNRHIVFIHGKGEGVLRQAIIQELKRRYPNCTHQDASFQEYGFGATEIIIH